MKIIAKSFVLFIFYLSIFSCKTDAGHSDNLIKHKETPEEIEWLKDYKEPSIKWGFIDDKGNEVIPQIYDDVRDFDKNGIALTNYKGRWGYIDKTNKVVIPFQYLDAHPFNDDLALIQVFNRTQFYIDKNGNKLFDCPGDECSSFKNGHAVFTKNGFKGLLNDKGQIVVENILDDIIFLDSTHFIAKSDDNYGIINVKGEWKIKPEYDKIYVSDNNLIRGKKVDVFVYLDINKLKPNSKMYESATDFSYQRSAIKKDGDYSLIDEKGNKIFTTKNILKPGGEGKWIEEENGKFRFIDSNGNIVTQKWYNALYQFEEGLAGFQEGEFWGYLDTMGSEVIPAELPLIWSCKEGKIRFISQGGYGFLTKDYQLAVEPKYIEARDFVNGYARVGN